MRTAFTLIELLVVIAIIAILSVVVILTLNPAELLRQSRDSNRISDLSVAKSGIALYLSSVTTPFIGTSTFCYIDASGLVLNNNVEGTSSCIAWFTTYAAGNMVSTTVANSRNVNGTGWIPINFNGIAAGGSPLSNEPTDPSNNDGIHFYTYIPSSTSLVFKLDAHMESQKYGQGGSNDVTTADGGTDPASYEAGTNLSL